MEESTHSMDERRSLLEMTREVWCVDASNNRGPTIEGGHLCPLFSSAV